MNSIVRHNQFYYGIHFFILKQFLLTKKSFTNLKNKKENIVKKLLLSFLFLVLAGSLLAQPTHYNWQNVGTSSNTFPFGQSAGKAVNWLFLPNSLINPIPVPSGMEITKVYWWWTSGGSRTYTNFHILMAQATITNLTSGSFYAGPWDTVYFNATLSMSGTTNSWSTPITLDTPYPYDPTKSLLMFIGQCGGPGSGMYIRQNTSPGGIKRVWSVGGCPFTPYSGGDASTLNFGVDVQSAAPPIGPVPEIIYYKFEDNPTPTTVTNFAIPGQGTNPATLSGTTALTSGGQFDSCIIGNGATNGGVVTGWNNSLGSGSWTISMWVNIPTDPTGLAHYMFGDGAGSFRCFHNGVAYPNNLLLRGTGITQVLVNGVGPTPTVVHFVYDSAASEIRTYKNGVYNTTVAQTPLNLAAGTGFKVGGYGSSRTMKARIDEFRVYSRALDSTEIALTWNHQLPIITGIPTPVLNMPDKFILSQNYPNPFNPTTTIDYQTPTKGLVILKVYDILGKEISTLVNQVKNAGSYTVEFNGSNLPSGTYFYRLEAGDNLDVKKMILLK